jgi:hypothetical protein
VNEPIPGGRLPDAVNGGGQAAKGRNRVRRRGLQRRRATFA